jgi:hypothetical protein
MQNFVIILQSEFGIVNLNIVENSPLNFKYFSTQICHSVLGHVKLN